MAAGANQFPSAVFQDYLQSIPDDLLESVAEDYAWLATLPFHDGSRHIDFERRLAWCREECARRGIFAG